MAVILPTNARLGIIREMRQLKNSQHAQTDAFSSGLHWCLGGPDQCPALSEVDRVFLASDSREVEMNTFSAQKDWPYKNSFLFLYGQLRVGSLLFLGWTELIKCFASFLRKGIPWRKCHAWSSINGEWIA